MILLGEQVSSLLESAKKSALIVAPFMRSEALSRLLNHVPNDVETTIVTRWRLADLLSGASDLGVYDLADAMNADLLLRSNLHAKLFAADNKCLAGSANVTFSALGWLKPANLELLISVRRDDALIVEFERELKAGAVRATVAQRDQLQNSLDQLQNSTYVISPAEDGTRATGLLNSYWIPRIKNPEDLYAVYSGNADAGQPLLRIMRDELAGIGAPSGLDEEGFRAWVAGTITQTPFFAALTKHFEGHGEVTEAEVASILQEFGEEAHNAREMLEIVGRWFTYFLREPHETARDTVKLIKAKRFGSAWVQRGNSAASD